MANDDDDERGGNHGNRRDFLRRGATAALGVGALGALSGGLAAGCELDAAEGEALSALTNVPFALHTEKYKQLVTFPEVRAEFVAALEEVTDGLLADAAAYTSFMEGTDAEGSLRVWDANEAMLKQLVGATDGTTRRGRLKRMLTVSELYDGVEAYKGPGFLDAEKLASSSSSSSSSSSISSGGDCATNGSATNGCCVIHTWGWSSGEGLCGILAAPQQPDTQR